MIKRFKLWLDKRLAPPVCKHDAVVRRMIEDTEDGIISWIGGHHTHMQLNTRHLGRDVTMFWSGRLYIQIEGIGDSMALDSNPDLIRKLWTCAHQARRENSGLNEYLAQASVSKGVVHGQ